MYTAPRRGGLHRRGFLRRNARLRSAVFADVWKALPKVVFSHTLHSVGRFGTREQLS